MAHNVLLVFSNPSEGAEDAYNDWYNNEHLQEVVALPEFVSARRFRFAADQIEGVPASAHSYIAIYEFEGEAKDALDRLQNELAAGTIVLPAVVESETIVAWAVESLGEEVSSRDAAGGR